MLKRKKELTPGEKNILELIHELYGKRHHHRKECFLNESGETLIFIRSRSGDARFAVNLSLLASMHDLFCSRLKEHYLMLEQEPALQLLSGEREPQEEYRAFLAAQLGGVEAEPAGRMAS